MGYLIVEFTLSFMNQKNKKADLQPFRRQMTHFLTDMSNRVEHQKLNQATAELPPG